MKGRQTTATDVISSAKTRSLTSIASGYVLSGVVSRVLAMVAIPVLVANVSPTDYGVYGVVQALVPAAAIVLSLSLGDALPIYFYEPETLELKREKIAGILVATFVIALALGVAVPGVWLLGDRHSSVIIGETLALIAATIVTRSFEPLRRSEEKPTSIVVSRIVAGAIFFVGASLAVTVFNLGVEAILGAFLIGEAVRALILVVGHSPLTSGHLHLRSLKIIPRLLPFAIPLILHSGSVFLLGYADRWLVAAILSFAAAGVYTLAYQIASVLLMITSSYNEAVSPRLYAAFQKGGERAMAEFHRRTAPVYFLLSAISAIGLAGLGAVYLLAFAPPTYRGAFWPLVIVLLGLVFQSMYLPHVNALLAIKRSKDVASRSLIYTLLNLVLNVALIPIIGITGAALATLIAFAGRYFSFARATKQHLELGATSKDLRAAASRLLLASVGRLPLSRAIDSDE